MYDISKIVLALLICYKPARVTLRVWLVKVFHEGILKSDRLQQSQLGGLLPEGNSITYVHTIYNTNINTIDKVSLEANCQRTFYHKHTYMHGYKSHQLGGQLPEGHYITVYSFPVSLLGVSITVACIFPPRSV